MSEVIVAFWTGTGNTAEMAEYVAEGIREGGAEAKVVSVDDISAADLKDAKAFALEGKHPVSMMIPLYSSSHASRNSISKPGGARSGDVT